MNDPFKTHGAFSWCELMTPDPEAAKRFYGTLFGWTLEDMDMGRGTYTVVKAGGAGIGGIMKQSPECAPDAPPHWGTYVTVEDVDATEEGRSARRQDPGPTDGHSQGRTLLHAPRPPRRRDRRDHLCEGRLRIAPRGE
jgi:predicted enzyme related to lactoylglutathione lyase